MSGLGRMFQGGKAPRRAKPANEFYPTPWAATAALLAEEAGRIARHGGPIHEPAAGDRALARVLEAWGFTTVESDLVPRARGVRRQDFLTLERRPTSILVTNPPFSLAHRFIEHAHALGYGLIVMLLKSNYFQAGVQRRALRKAFPPVAKYELGWRLDFLDLGNPVLEAAWFVWEPARPSRAIWQVLDRPDNVPRETIEARA